MVLPTHRSPPLHTSRRELVGYVGAATPCISIKWASAQIGFGIFFNKYSTSMDLHHLWSMFFHQYIFLSLVGCGNSSQSFHSIVTPRLARWKAWMTQKHEPLKKLLKTGGWNTFLVPFWICFRCYISFGMVYLKNVHHSSPNLSQTYYHLRTWCKTPTLFAPWIQQAI